MAKKKKLKKEQANRRKEELENLIRNGKCLKCGKPMINNHKSCKACNKKAKLKAKANRRGKESNYYLK